MPTIEGIRADWSRIRSDLGNLICHIDGKMAQLQDKNEAYKNDVSQAYQEGYVHGLEDAWEVACRIVQMDVHERAKAFFIDADAATHDEPFKRYSAEEAIQKLKEYDAIIRQVTHSNADKFVETFGFMPAYEIMNDGRSYFPCFEDEFWNAEYKSPEDES